jgi:hypothetical protein
MWQARSTHVVACPAASSPTTLAATMTKFHVLAAMGDFADELRSLGIHEAPSAPIALARCLAELGRDPVSDHEAAHHDPEVVEMARRDQQQLRDALAEPDVSFIVTPIGAEAHFVRDFDGEVRSADEVERRRARMRRDLGVDVV